MVIEIDPDGDLLITLTPPTEPFAVWPDDQPPVATSDDYDLEDDESASPADLEHDKPAASELFQFKVSSKHLSLASPRFKKMLTGPWIEATTTHPDGLRHVDIEGFYPDAFRVVMNIIHCRNGEVDKLIPIEALAKICMVIDDLDCFGAVCAFSDIWIRNKKDFFDSWKDLQRWYDAHVVLGRRLIMAMFISIALQAPDRFRDTTLAMILICPTEEIPTLGLPISGKLFDAIRAKREALLESLIGKIHAIFERLVTQSTLDPEHPHPSSSACQRFLAGTLASEMFRIRIYRRPCKPFDGVTIYEICSSMRDLSTQPLIDPPLCKNATACSFKYLLGPVMREIAYASTGLELEDFRPRPSQR